MWALPDIQKLNEKAKADFKTKKADTLEGHQCDYCNKPAEHAVDYYDVFGKHPKGQLYTCEEHNEEYGSQPEGYFYCESCERLHVENYTWEYYHAQDVINGGLICLNCALDQYLADDASYIKKPAELTIANVRSAPHLIPVAGTHWQSKLKFHGSQLFDSMNGHCVTGGGLEELRELCSKAIKASKTKRCVLILDGVFQFSVTVGVYSEKGGRK